MFQRHDLSHLAHRALGTRLADGRTLLWVGFELAGVCYLFEAVADTAVEALARLSLQLSSLVVPAVDLRQERF